MTKIVPLTQDCVTLVDDEDYESLNRWRWFCAQGYAGRQSRRVEHGDGPRRTIFMHRVIVGATDGQLCDHVNGDGLDNRRCNLRLCTRSQNACNQRSQRSNNTSGYKGVCWRGRESRWQAYIGLSGRFKSLGFYDSAVEAATAYDRAAREWFGEFARINDYGGERG